MTGVHLRPGTLIGSIALIGWLVVFTLGAVISSEPYRTQLGAFTPAGTGLREYGLEVWRSVVATAMVLVTYTPPNIAVLCCLAALAGSVGNQLMISGSGSGHRAAAIRGFFVYLLMLSGLLLITGDPFASLEPGQYIRLAGSSSLMAFIVGWQPSLLSALIDRVLQKSAIQGDDDGRG